MLTWNLKPSISRPQMKVSVIVTVLNEGPAIRRLLDSLAAQTRTPDEVVVVDGGSQDDTLTVLQAYAQEGRLPLRVLVEPDANISRGRNGARREHQERFGFRVQALPALQH